MRSNVAPALWAMIGAMVGLALTPASSGSEILPVMLACQGFIIGLGLRAIRRSHRHY